MPTSALPQWTASTGHIVGDYTQLAGGSVLLCTTAGTTGSTPPVAPGVGSAITDGTAHWVQTADYLGTWPTQVIDGVNYFIISTGQFRIPVDWDPSSLMFFAAAVPAGGLGNLAGMVQGAPGETPTFLNTVNITEIPSSDTSTAAWATFTEVSPDVWQLSMALHAGAQGAPGTTALNLANYGTPVSGQMLIVDPTATTVVFGNQLCGPTAVPTVINNVPQGQTNYTISQVRMGPYGFDWRPVCRGQQEVTGLGADVAVDLMVRLGAGSNSLNGETAGNVVARGFGRPGIAPPAHNLCAAKPPGSADSFDRVAAGQTAVLYLRTEKQSGTSDYTTDGSRGLFAVHAEPIPNTGVPTG